MDHGDFTTDRLPETRYIANVIAVSVSHAKVEFQAGYAGL
jgi:hypothetical protein